MANLVLVAVVCLLAFTATHMVMDISEDEIVEVEVEKPVEQQVELYYELDSNKILYHDLGVYDNGWEVLDG